MAQTGMDTNAVEEKLSTMKTGAENLDLLVSNVSNLQEPLEAAWTSEEATAAIEYLNQLSTKMQDMSIEVMSIHDWVNQVKENYIEVAHSGANGYSC